VSEVDGRLHGPHLPASGIPARLCFDGELLRVAGQEREWEEVPAESLAVSITGFNEDTLQLSWQKSGESHAVTVADADAQRRLLEDAPPGIARRLARGHSKIQYHRRKWQVVIGAVIAFVLLMGLAWWQSEAITQWMANRVSLETEIGIGDRALGQLELEHTLTQEGPAAEMIARIGARLTATSRYRYRWYVSDEREINAYALPGGIVVVNAGMIEAAQNAEELAGVLAHEVQHIEHRHTLQQMIHAAGWAAVLAVALGDVSAVTAITLHQLGNLRNSRKLEAQADTEGMKALARAGIPLQGMPALFRRLHLEQEGRGGDGVALLSSHPATAQRIADLEQLAGSLRCDCRTMEVDWPGIQKATREWRVAQ
jgi:beta-barrel assembly-enhancing protease